MTVESYSKAGRVVNRSRKMRGGCELQPQNARLS
jgi:hypothetical protein